MPNCKHFEDQRSWIVLLRRQCVHQLPPMRGVFHHTWTCISSASDLKKCKQRHGRKWAIYLKQMFHSLAPYQADKSWSASTFFSILSSPSLGDNCDIFGQIKFTSACSLPFHFSPLSLTYHPFKLIASAAWTWWSTPVHKHWHDWVMGPEDSSLVNFRWDSIWRIFLFFWQSTFVLCQLSSAAILANKTSKTKQNPYNQLGKPSKAFVMCLCNEQ